MVSHEPVRRANARHALPLEIACVGEETEVPFGISDPELLLWAEQHSFVLISNDARNMPGHVAGWADLTLPRSRIFVPYLTDAT